MGDQCGPLRPQGVEELPQGGTVTTRSSPHQPAAVVINHHSQVLVVALVGDLINPDPAQPREQIDPLFRYRPTPGTRSTRQIITTRINSRTAVSSRPPPTRPPCHRMRRYARRHGAPTAPRPPSARAHGNSPAARPLRRTPGSCRNPGCATARTLTPVKPRRPQLHRPHRR